MRIRLCIWVWLYLYLCLYIRICTCSAGQCVWWANRGRLCTQSGHKKQVNPSWGRMQETPAHKYKYTNTQIQKKDARDARAYNSCPGIFAIPQLSLGFWDELTRYQFSRLFLGKLDPVSGSTLRAQLSWVQLSGAQFAWNH